MVFLVEARGHDLLQPECLVADLETPLTASLSSRSISMSITAWCGEKGCRRRGRRSRARRAQHGGEEALGEAELVGGLQARLVRVAVPVQAGGVAADPPHEQVPGGEVGEPDLWLK